MTPAESAEALAWVHKGWDHLRLQRPIAAWASWNRALRIDHDQKAAQEALEILAAAEDLPAAARAVYRFRPPIGDDRRARWDAHFRGRDLTELEAAADAFAELADADPADSSARYNQALALAWLGRNVEAIGALELVVEVDASREFEAAIGAWMLAEVLRQGDGEPDLADDLNYVTILTLQDGMPDLVTLLKSFAEEAHAVPAPIETDARVYELRYLPAFAPADGPRKIRGTLIVSGRTVRLSTPLRDEASDIRAVLQYWAPNEADPEDSITREEFTKRGGIEAPGTDWVYNGPLSCTQEALAAYAREEIKQLPFPLLDAAVWTFRLPEGPDEAARSDMARDRIERFFEREWINVERHSLSRDPGGLSPIKAAQLAAAGDLATKAKLTALVRSREQLAMRTRVAGLYEGYPFDRLRRRLGLDLVNPASVDPKDVSCMSWQEASRLDPETLDDQELLDLAVLAIQADWKSELQRHFNRLYDERVARQGPSAKPQRGRW